jgi:hypothetical protein
LSGVEHDAADGGQRDRDGQRAGGQRRGGDPRPAATRLRAVQLAQECGPDLIGAVEASGQVVGEVGFGGGI